MIREFDIHGVFISALLGWALVALVLNLLLQRVFSAIGFYKLVWHRPLFDFAMFVILLGGLVVAASNWTILQ